MTLVRVTHRGIWCGLGSRHVPLVEPNRSATGCSLVDRRVGVDPREYRPRPESDVAVDLSASCNPNDDHHKPVVFYGVDHAVVPDPNAP